MFASSEYFFTLTNLDVHFHFNSETSVLRFLTGGWSISKTTPSALSVASGVKVDGFLLYCQELACLLCVFWVRIF